MKIFVLIFCLPLVYAGRSPYADYVERLIKNGELNQNTRFSNDVIEDALLDVPGLIRKYNYPLEEHSITTPDGYVLGVQRIPHGRDRNNIPGVRKPVVFMMHGMLSSSADYVIMGPGNALGYILAEEGYDVWLGNARGTFYSKNHTHLDSDSYTGYWKFSWDEIGNIDIPACIDYILDHTKQEKLHYVGHSQGTTSFFVMASLNPDYNNKIISMQALAPVAFMDNNEEFLFQFFSKYTKYIEAIGFYFGFVEILPNSDLFTSFGIKFCQDHQETQQLCNLVFYYTSGKQMEQFNSTMIPALLGHVPAGISIRQLSHYGQGIAKKTFRRYDHGVLGNMLEYRRSSPPDYELSKITAPVFLHYSGVDNMAHVFDVEKLARQLGGPVYMNFVNGNFSHIDFIWAKDAKEILYNNIVSYMKVMDTYDRN